MRFFEQLLSSDFMPHGFCYLWNPRILWLHVISDGLIALSYYFIPFTLIYFIRKNRDLPVNRIFWLFGAFILACGTTHVMEIWNVWHGSYALAGVIKAFTAAISVVTAASLVTLVPKVISLPERMYLQGLNRELQQEVAERTRISEPVDTALRRNVTTGFVVAIVLTVFIGVSGWQSARRAANDAYWVAHTYDVMKTIQRTTRDVIVAETSARAFALSGQEPLLAHYQETQKSIFQDEAELRQKTADNLSQQRRLDVLEPQVRAALDFGESIIAQRRTSQAYPRGTLALEAERHIDTVRATTREMYGEETRLLSQRSQRAKAGQLLTKLIAIIGALVGVCLWCLARYAVSREISVSARARTQLAALNAELEERVQRRTAALQTEIADRKQAQERAERLAAVVESSDDAIISKDLRGIITAWNRGAEKLFGYSPTEIVGRPMLLLPPDRAAEEADILRRVARGESVDHFETVRVRKDGALIHVSATFSPIRDNHGVIVGASKIARDITECKDTEESLKRSLATSEKALKELADQKFALDQHAIVAVTDVHGTITYVNDKFCAISQYSTDELIGQNHRILNSGHHPKEFFQQMYHAIANGKVWHGEIKNRAQDGSFYWVDTTIVPTVSTDGKPQQYVAIRADISERKLVEEQVAKLNEDLEKRVAERTAELEAANKELESFSYSVSHDLRAPLRHIGGFSKMLVEEYGSTLDPGAQHYLDRIQAGTQKMGQLVDELLNLARVGRHALQRQLTDLNALVADVISILEPDAAGRQVSWEIADLPAIECDAVLTKQIFQNLLANALKFTRTRAPAVITIDCRQDAEEGPPVFTIRDNGVGFSMKYQDKLFGVFQRLHRPEDFEGTGIGLATVQRIVQKHGGRVWAEGETEKGAAFHFTLGVGNHVEATNNAAAAAGGQS